MCSDTVLDRYERHARDYDRDRDRSLRERDWLDRFLSGVSSGGTILDVGCGTGEPIARYFVRCGFRDVGVDGSPAMIEIGRARLPDVEWIVADMRELDLGRRFDGILARDSLFHLRASDQRPMFRRFGAPSAPPPG